MVTRREPSPRRVWSATSCPSCGEEVRPVIVGRRKSMGTWIPVWGPGPCRNPDCARHREDHGETDSPRDGSGAHGSSVAADGRTAERERRPVQGA